MAKAGTNLEGRRIDSWATEADVASVLEFGRRPETVPSTTDDTSGPRQLMHTDPEALIIAVDNGAVVGTLIAALDGWRGNMYRLAVLPDHRRRGIGRALVEPGEGRLRDRGARRITALVAP